MSALHAFAPGKVNLCLFLGPLRPDGLHDLVSVVESVSLADELELAPAGEGTIVDEVVCPGVDAPNLAASALAAFRRATGWDAPPQRLTVTKRVPVAAGMGGGSSDAAATLRLAARAAGRAVDAGLVEVARGLGSDVPVTLAGGAALVGGAGEEVVSLAGLDEHAMVVVPLDARLATGAVFERADRLDLARSREDLAERRAALEEALAAGRVPAGDLLHNDLAEAARSLCPALDEAREAVGGAGADRVLLTGSGPTVVGLLTGADAVSRAQDAALRLRERFPRARAVSAVDPAYGEPRAAAVTA